MDHPIVPGGLPEVGEAKLRKIHTAITNLWGGLFDSGLTHQKVRSRSDFPFPDSGKKLVAVSMPSSVPVKHSRAMSPCHMGIPYGLCIGIAAWPE